MKRCLGRYLVGYSCTSGSMSADARGLVHVRKRLRRSRKFTQQTLMRVQEEAGTAQRSTGASRRMTRICLPGRAASDAAIRKVGAEDARRVHRWGWQLILHPDGTTTTYGPNGQILRSHHRN